MQNIPTRSKRLQYSRTSPLQIRWSPSLLLKSSSTLAMVCGQRGKKIPEERVLPQVLLKRLPGQMLAGFPLLVGEWVIKFPDIARRVFDVLHRDAHYNF